jgi:type VI secretion system secreted protein VgrG
MQSITGIKGYQRVVAGASTTTVAALWAQVSGGSSGSACAGARSQTVGALKLVKAKQISLEAKSAVTTNVAALVVKSGGGGVDEAKGAVAITAGAGLSVKANGITVSATSSLTVIAAGCVIKMSSGGDVSVKAANIDLRGTKAFGQVLHRSN